MKGNSSSLLTVVTFLLLVGLIIPVYAHANLIRSDPPANSVLPTSPQQIKLYFTEQVDPKLSGATVYDSTGKEVDAGYSVDSSDATIIIVTLPVLPSGVYTVSWHAISSIDGHHTSGSFAFGVGNVTVNIEPTSSTAYTFPSPLEITERWLNLLADILFLGGGSYAIFVWIPIASIGRNELSAEVRQKISLRSSRLLTCSAILALIATIMLLIVESIAASPSNSFANIIATGYTILTSSKLREYWTFRMLASIVAISASATLLRVDRAAKKSWMFMLAVGLMLSLSTSLTSHNAASTEYDPIINLFADWIHLIGVSVWVGGLAYLVVTITALNNLKESKGKLVAQFLRRFSWLAIIAVGVVGLTGIYNLVLEVGSFSALFVTAYGRILLVKLCIFAPMIALGAFNQFILYDHIVATMNAKSKRKPRQIGRWLGRFKFSLRSELTLGVILLLVVGILTASVPVAQTPIIAPSNQPVPTVLHGYSPQGVNVTLKIYPLQVGDNHFEIDFTTPQGASVTNVNSVFVKFKYLDKFLGVSIANATVSTSPGTYALDGTYLSFAGNWQLQVWAQRAQGFDVIVPFQIDVPPFSLRFSELPLSNTAGPYGIAVDKNGEVWFAETGTGSIGRYEPTTNTLNEFSLPQTGSRPFYIAIDTNGTVWISETQYNQIVKFDSSTNTFKAYSIPTVGAVPGGIAVDNSGNVWFTEEIGDKIGRLNPSTGTITEFQIPTTDSIPIQTTIDPHGLVWFTESKGGKIGMINPANGSVLEFEPRNGTLLGPTGITVAPDGSVWFTEHGGNRITHFNVVNDTFYQYPIPTNEAFPFGIFYQSNRVWFVEHIANAIGTFDPATGTFASFSIPNNSSDVQLLAVDKAGNVWFTLPASNVLGVLTSSTSSLQLAPNSNNGSFISLATIAAVVTAVVTIASFILGRRRMKRKVRIR